MVKDSYIFRISNIMHKAIDSVMTKKEYQGIQYDNIEANLKNVITQFLEDLKKEDFRI